MQIGVVTTSSPIEFLEEDRISSAYEYLKTQGFEVYEHPVCRIKTGYVSGTIYDRCNAIHDLVKDPNIDIIMTFWGGDNTNQILDILDYELIKQNPKIFIGYSDTGTLLNVIYKMTGIITYLGPAIITFTKPDIFPESIEYLKKVVLDKSTVEYIPPKRYAKDSFYNRDDNKRIIELNSGLRISNHGLVKNKKIVAINLTMLQSLFGTPYEPDMNDAILFCEVAESVHMPELDRMFVQLRQNGTLDKISGLVFSKCTEDSEINDEGLENIFKANIKNDIPIVYNFDCGHTDPIITVPIGGFCSIDTAELKIVFNPVK